MGGINEANRVDRVEAPGGSVFPQELDGAGLEGLVSKGEENGDFPAPAEVILFLDARITALSEKRDERRAWNSGSNAEIRRFNHILGEIDALGSLRRFLSMDKSMRTRAISEITRENKTSSENKSLE